MNNDDLGATTALGLHCDSCGSTVVPEHRKTVEEMHNTECADCNEDLLGMKNMAVVRVSDIRGLIQDIDLAMPSKVPQDMGITSQQEAYGAEKAFEWLMKKMDSISEGDGDV